MDCVDGLIGLQAMEFLHNVTRPFAKQPGFVARTAVRCGGQSKVHEQSVCRLIQEDIHSGP